MSTRTLDDHTRHALATADIDGRHVRLTTGQLTPDAYAPIKTVLENLGGNWNRRLEALVFPAGSNPAALIQDVLTTGRVPLHARTAEGFVRTPDEIADDLVSYPHSDLDRLPAGARVLEPSAGDGALVDAILGANPDVKVTAVEPNEQRADALDGTPGTELVRVTLEEYAATGPGQFDAIVMNPPFAVPGNRTLWIDHVLAAWELLAPGALLAAIVPAAFHYRQDKRHQAMRELVEQHGGHQRLPHDAFQASGTGISTAIIRLRKPLAGAAGRDPHLFRQYTGREIRVQVATPRLTGEAVAAAPVQVWHDAWRRADRVLRYRAQCVACGWLLWGFDDGENDCRGVLGDFSCGFSLDPFEYDLVGPRVGLCPMCANNDRGTYERALATAEAVWSAVPAVVEPALEPWSPVAGVQLDLFDSPNLVRAA